MDIRKVSFNDSKIKWEKLTTLHEYSPFQCWQYLNVFSTHFSAQESTVILEIFEGDKTVALLPFEKQENTLILLGMKPVLGTETITDYGDIILSQEYKDRINEIWDLARINLKKLAISKIIFENIREESDLYKFFKNQSGAVILNQEVSPFILLPSSWDLYIESLPRVEKKELKRKLKRLDTVPHYFKINPADDLVIFTDFIRLHRISNQDKKQFMSVEMEQFFWDLANLKTDSWKTYIARLQINGELAAAIYFFNNKKSCLLYNSGFDPAYKYYSNGLMLHALLIKHNIENGIHIHDFLRGNERYKYDLGAQDHNLYKITIAL